MAEPYIAFAREAEEARRRFRDFRNKQSLNPVTGMGLDPAAAGSMREQRALEGGRLQDIRRDLTRASVRSQSDAGMFAPGENQPTGIDPALTSRVRASVAAQRELDPLPASPQQFMDAAQGRSMGMTPNEFARLKGLRDSGTEAGAPYKISDAAFRGGADALAKIDAESRGQPTDNEARRLRMVADVPTIPAAATGPTQAEQLRMAAVKQQDREAGPLGALALAKYDAEKQADRDREAKSKDLDVQAKETQIRAARIAAGLEQAPDFARAKRPQVIADASSQAAADNIVGTLVSGTSPLANPDWGKANSNLDIIANLPPEDARVAAMEALARLRQEGISESSGSYYGRNEEYARIIAKLRAIAGEAQSQPPSRTEAPDLYGPVRF